MEKIDFVVTWVDGNDPNWLKEKNKFDIGKEETDISESRYRDWGLLKYWFRGVEKFAPWVNKIYFITWGHIPSWLNIYNPKLVIINHKDYIPKEYLPTFNSNVIELNINRIKELSENFVLFNDDMYLIKDTKETDFFENNKPCDSVALSVHCPQKSMIIQNISFNNAGIINEHFNFKECLKNNKKIWYSLKNGKGLMRTLVLKNCPRFPGFMINHISCSYNKSTFNEVWKKEPEALKETSTHKFRQANEVNHWLMKEWQIASGKVVNQSRNFGKAFFIREESTNQIGKEIIDYIKNQRVKEICINDGQLTGKNYNKLVKEIIQAFEEILPIKSSFEK